MSEAQFRKEILARLAAARRVVARLEAVKNGTASMIYFWREPCKVSAHTREGHYVGLIQQKTREVGLVRGIP